MANHHGAKGYYVKVKFSNGEQYFMGYYGTYQRKSALRWAREELDYVMQGLPEQLPVKSLTYDLTIIERHEINQLDKWVEVWLPMVERIAFPRDLKICRICSMRYVTNSVVDDVLHRKRHLIMAHGGMPEEVCYFLEKAGWAAARGSSSEDVEVGKLAVVYSWWAKAREMGLPADDFDAYMEVRLKLIDALVDGDLERINVAYAAINK